jgi:hypothetical protein
MPRRINPAKVEEWTQRFRRFNQSSESVVSFCKSEGVFPPAFYLWKKRLGIITPPKPTALRKRSSGFRRVHLISPPASDLRATTVCLGPAIEIRLGNDLSVVEVVMKQLLAASAATRPAEGAKSS